MLLLKEPMISLEYIATTRMTKLPLEVWVLIILIVEVLVVNWRLLSVTSNDGHQTIASCTTSLTGRVWKPAHIPCDEIVSTRDIQKISSQPSKFVFHRPSQQGKDNDVVSSVAVRMARSVAKRQHASPNNDDDDAMCRLSFYSTESPKNGFPSFQWTMVQDPTQQAIDFFYRQHVSYEKKIPSDESFQQAVLDYRQKDDASVSIDNFDFVGVMERLDESLVVMKLLLDLELKDLIYLENRTPFELHTNDNVTTCVYQVRPYISPGMRMFFTSAKWNHAFQRELELWQMANASLDLTIEALGRARVQQEVSRFRHLLQQVQSECSKHLEYFPCTSSGERQRRQYCHFDSIGCGHACLDDVANADIG